MLDIHLERMDGKEEAPLERMEAFVERMISWAKGMTNCCSAYNGLHGVISKKTDLFPAITVRT
jgi:hypothetical protein